MEVSVQDLIYVIGEQQVRIKLLEGDLQALQGQLEELTADTDKDVEEPSDRSG